MAKNRKLGVRKGGKITRRCVLCHQWNQNIWHHYSKTHKKSKESIETLIGEEQTQCDTLLKMAALSKKQLLSIGTEHGLSNIDQLVNIARSLGHIVHDSEIKLTSALDEDERYQKVIQRFPISVDSPVPSYADIKKIIAPTDVKEIKRITDAYRRRVDQEHVTFITNYFQGEQPGKHQINHLMEKKQWVKTKRIETMLNKVKWVDGTRQSHLTDSELLQLTATQNWDLEILYNLSGRGRGISTTKNLEKGLVVCDYKGILLGPMTKAASLSYLEGHANYYNFQIRGDKGWYVINASYEDQSFGRLINHSKLHPNCKAILKTIDSRVFVFMVTTKDIPAGQELLYDYMGYDLPDCVEGCVDCQPSKVN